jgi:hypothetical protein
MSTRGKLLIGILVLTVLTVSGSILAYQAFGGMGTLIVDVHEKYPGGDMVHLEVPGVLIPMTMMCVPDHAFVDCDIDDEEMRYAGPVLRAITKELRHMPDTEIVYVETVDETISIVKRGKNLYIDVDTPQEEVHVTIPVKLMESVGKKMERVVWISI